MAGHKVVTPIRMARGTIYTPTMSCPHGSTAIGTGTNQALALVMAAATLSRFRMMPGLAKSSATFLSSYRAIFSGEK